MSEFSISVVRLDPVSAKQSAHVGAAITGWLLGSGAIAVNNRFDELWQPSAWMPGPAFRAVLADLSWADHVTETANSGVDITTVRDVYHPVENDETPTCPSCGMRATGEYEDSYGQWLQAWMDEAIEPVFTCLCGWSGPVGDWAGEFSIAIGAPAVTFHNWPEPTQPFLTELRGMLGGRTMIVRTHL